MPHIKTILKACCVSVHPPPQHTLAWLKIILNPPPPHPHCVGVKVAPPPLSFCSLTNCNDQSLIFYLPFVGKAVKYNNVPEVKAATSGWPWLAATDYREILIHFDCLRQDLGLRISSIQNSTFSFGGILQAHLNPLLHEVSFQFISNHDILSSNAICRLC